MKKDACLFLFLLPFLCLSQPKKLTVYFGFNKYNLDLVFESKIENIIQDKVVEHIYIEAHCDSIGSDFYNDGLSLRRAEEVKKYFVSKNVDASLIEIRASGKKSPLNNNENESDRALNRRAEISVSFRSTILAVVSDSVLKDSTEVKNTSLENIENAEVGSTIKLENINFFSGMHIWLPRSEKTLKQLLNTLIDNPALEIEIQGHVCCIPYGDGPDFEPGNRAVFQSIGQKQFMITS